MTLFHTAIAVSLVASDYNATEGEDMSVDVCVEVVMGTVNQAATVELTTISGSATGEMDIMITPVIVVLRVSRVYGYCVYHRHSALSIY